MARCPFAVFMPVPRGANDPPVKIIGAVLHVDGGNASSLFRYFNGLSGGIESHFHIPKTRPIEQYRDTAYEADANYQGNSFMRDGVLCGLMSIETQGACDGTGWNAKQLADIKRLLLWASETHDFPLRRIPAWNGSGVGYHVMFGAPGPWTPRAKECPCKKRIAQYENVLIPWMRNPTLDGGTEMELSDRIPLKSDANVKWSNTSTTVEGALSSLLYYTLWNRNLALTLTQKVAAQDTLLAAIAARVDIDEAEFAAMKAVAKEGASEALQDMIDEARVTLITNGEGEDPQ